MKRRANLPLIVSTVSGFVLLIQLFWHIFPALLLPFFRHSASSIGIIGGADGPTAVFVTDSYGSFFSMSTLWALLQLLPGVTWLVATILVWVRQRKG